MNADIERLPNGRRHLHLRIGPFAIDVVEIPARCLEAHDWALIQLARRSYLAMWGTEMLSEDRFDGRGNSAYDTHHYLAWVKEEGDPGKLVTMRKVKLAPSRLTVEQIEQPLAMLPPDIRFWAVHSDDGSRLPLWEILKSYVRRVAPDEARPELRIASLSRTGTFPYRERDRSYRRRERTAIAFAAIQLLAVGDGADLLYVSHLCPELQERVLRVGDVDGRSVAPAHFNSEEILGLPGGSVRMDNRLPVVREHKANLPGYLLDNDSARDVILRLLESGRISAADLRPTVALLVEAELALGRERRELVDLLCAASTSDHNRLAEALTRPVMFKYMVPRILSDEPLEGMSGPEFRDALIDGTDDGPFSSTRSPRDWLHSAQAVLEAAAAKYG